MIFGRCKAQGTVIGLKASAILKAICIVLAGNMAWAGSERSDIAAPEHCPSQFDVVDLGRWVTNESGEDKLDFGGVLYRVTPARKPWRDWIPCVSPEHLGKPLQVRDGKPVPLVVHFIDADIGFRYMQRPSGDYSYDVVRGQIRQFPSEVLALAATETRNREAFASWIETADARAETVFRGKDYVCLFDRDNPELAGFGGYSCLATIPGAPHPDTRFGCSRWVGCYAEFSVGSGIVVTLKPETLPQWDAGAQVTSIPDAVRFWSSLVLASIENFEASIVSRGREEMIRIED